jgi:hypothetical protein
MAAEHVVEVSFHLITMGNRERKSGRGQKRDTLKAPSTVTYFLQPGLTP